MKKNLICSLIEFFKFFSTRYDVRVILSAREDCKPQVSKEIPRGGGVVHRGLMGATLGGGGGGGGTAR